MTATDFKLTNIRGSKPSRIVKLRFFNDIGARSETTWPFPTVARASEIVDEFADSSLCGKDLQERIYAIWYQEY